MIFYLGNKVDSVVDEKTRILRNKVKSWKYGYDAATDTVIISKDGTLGEVYNFDGLKIGLPQKPDHKEIINHKITAQNQKWNREALPKGINEYVQNSNDHPNDYIENEAHEDFITEQFRRRKEGVWVYIKGNPIYITGTYWFGLQYVREQTDFADFRNIQNELMIFWEACKADQRSYGMQYVKNRRMGASFLAIIEILESGTINEDKILGIISKKGDDSRKIFNRLIKSFKRLPLFFQPLWDGTNTPKKELILDVPTKKRAKNEVVSNDGLGSSISWHNTEINAMDGDAIFRSLLDECFAKGTKILMEDLSFKNIEDIKVGDMVITEGGKVIPVRKTCHGYSELFKVEQPYEKDYVVTLNHRLFLEQRCKVKSIHDDGEKIIRVGDYLKLGKYKKRTTFGLRSKGLEFDEAEVLLSPRILGLWLADGDKTNSGFAVNIRDDKETLQYLKDYCAENDFDYRIKKTHSDACIGFYIKRPKSDQHLNGNVCHNKFVDSLKAYNLIGNKHIPIEYLKNSKEIRLQLLAGILDADGHLANKNNSYHYQLASSIESLANQYNFLCQSLGFKTTFKKRISNLNTEYWTISISGDLSEIPCMVARKTVPKDYVRKYNSHINKINVKSVGYGDFYGITLDTEDEYEQRVILEDFTVSLNSGKYPKDVPFDKYWYIVKTSHTKGINITGKSMVVSTVNSKKKGGAAYEVIWNDSDISKRNENGETKSGLYRIFIAAKYCLEGMFDEYGFTIIDDPEKPVKTDNGVMTSVGSITYLKNKENSFKDDPESLNEQKRQFPETVRDAFRDESDDCEFNLTKLLEQIDHNKYELEDSIYGNTEVERGNFSWENGVPDTLVKWNPDPLKGRFWIAKNCHPPKEYRNLKSKKLINGVLAWAPENENIGCFGVDPYNRDKTADGRQSEGSIHLCTKFNTGPFPNNTFILEYIDRASKVELFYEDVLMAMVYYSVPMLPELSSEKFSSFFVDRGYRHFVLNNPFKDWKDLSDTEKKCGGVPPQDTKIGDRQYYALQSYIEDHIGVARDESERLIGTMGNMPFNRTLNQWKETDPKNRTKFDAYISSTLALLGNEKKIKQVEETPPVNIYSLYRKYDNSGNVSQVK